MATIFRNGVVRLNFNQLSTRLCKKPKTYNVVQVAFMTRESYRTDDAIRPAPFPYWRKNYNLLNMIKDPIMYRFYENSKIIVIDGPPAVGKSKVAEQIADQFGMLYMPAPTFDELYINKYGFDIRSLDSKLPLSARSFDISKFLENPNDIRTAWCQLLYLQMRHEQYVNAMLHLLSTGQGVVLNRSVYSDIVFMKTLVDFKYVRKEVWQYYLAMRKIVFKQFCRPHLIIYLDVSPDRVKEKIKKRCIPYEVNSKVLTTEYLSTLEKNYKEKYLIPMSTHSHLLMYDWKEGGDIMTIVDNIESLDLDSCNDIDGKMGDWIFHDVAELRRRRLEYHDYAQLHTSLMESIEDAVPDELLLNPDDKDILQEQLSKEFDEKYEDGVKEGASSLWRSETFALRRTPRDFINRDKFMV